MSRPESSSSPLSEQPDEGLALASGLGDRAAFVELLARYGVRVRAVLQQRMGDPHVAEDLSQEVWIKVFGALPGYRAQGAFRPWLFAIALNHARDALRSRARDRLVLLDDLPQHPVRSAVAEPDRTLERRDEALAVDGALREVDEPFRTALALVDLGGLSQVEAAAAAGCRLGTLKSRLHRGRRLFRDAFLRRDAVRRHARPDPCGSMP